ncbi:MAG: hypothetical protein HFI77_15315 [Lachnospiraceae bacterium]|nr:hypothetical protein [Lachnospiraceae bacterium]MCI8877334.1 hypothetical protein [Lachnospiraceae bacterium]
MKIAFWSEEQETDTTFHMAVVACASALMYPLCIAVVSSGCRDKKLESYFMRKEELEKGKSFDWQWQGERDQKLEKAVLAAEQQEYFLTGGLDYLLSREQPERLTQQEVRRNLYQVIENRLYCLSRSQRREEWWYEPHVQKRLEQVMHKIEDSFDLVFIDCGNKKDDFTQRMLQEADLCVLSMNQEAEMIGEYYRKPKRFPGKIFFLVGNYFENGVYTRKNLERIYRVEEELLGAIPYHPQLQAASKFGKTEGELKDSMEKGRNLRFQQELTRTVRLILKKTGVEIKKDVR